jgi:Mrp family chromosome partitioning ATPase
MLRIPLSFFSWRSGSIRDLQDAVSLDLPVLGAIGAFDAEPGSSLPKANYPEALESYRRLVDAVRVPDFHVRGRAIVVTNTEAGGGKPGVALNLATLLARGGSKVVLVEADLRLATRRRVGDGSTSSGFAGLLVNQLRTASSAVVHTMEPKLKLLPAGSATGTLATLMRSPRLPLVIDSLRRLTDHVIFEAPSALDWQEMLHLVHLVHLADMTLLVLEAGKTDRDAARRSTAALREANNGTLGLVLTGAPAGSLVPQEEAKAASVQAPSRCRRRGAGAGARATGAGCRRVAGRPGRRTAADPLDPGGEQRS